MPRKKKVFDFASAMRRLQETGISKPVSRPNRDCLDTLPTITERVRMIMGVIDQPKRKTTDMIFFVMYDIEDNRVRRLVVKYLEQKGCHRVQKSIFLADLPSSEFVQIRSDLAEVQAVYDNNDSILLVPISTDYLNSMKIIGKAIDVDLILKRKNVLFF